MCTIDAWPLNICQGVGLKIFVKGLNPEYKVPSRTTVTKYLHKMYLEAKEEVENELKGQPISVTSDI